MTSYRRLAPVPLLVALSIVGVGCTSTSAPDAAAPRDAAGAAQTVAEAPAEAVAPPTEVNAVPQGESGAPADTNPAAAERPGAPAWLSVTLSDANSGAEFALADFAGKTVYVQTFATWCASCKQQLGNVKVARPDLGDDVVVVALSVEAGIDDDTLRAYATDAGFDWFVAATPIDVLRALADQFGQTVTNPPATPHFIVGPDGSVSELATGIKAPDEIVRAVRQAQG